MKKLNCSLCLFLVYSSVIAQQNPVYKKADSLFLSQNYSLAKTEYENIFKSDAGNALVWNRLAFSCYNLALYDDAVKNFNKSLTLNPDDQLKGIIYTRLAKSYGAKGDKENTLSSLQKAVDANYLNWADLSLDKNLQLVKDDAQFAKIKESLFAKVNPCMNNPKSREFDFWVGDWEVFDTKTGRKAGTNSIIIVSGGCMLLENWLDVTQTNAGTSINYVNTETGKWEQVYKDNGMSMPMKYTEGEYGNNAMRFLFISKTNDGAIKNGHFIFEKKGDDEVRQYSETSADNGKTWQMEFDLTYKRKK